ncbi:hypothetical protein [Streptomyces sp. LN590]|uniref:hypothetical protein n=1 Tax=Streptomyces sp. LN590 TaxID=3112980 RepID=UPI003715B23D
MDIVERALTVAHNGVRGGACEGFLAAPVRGSRAGVLVLAGSASARRQFRIARSDRGVGSTDQADQDPG